MSPIRTYALTLLLVTGCAGPGLLASEPMGKQLERALEEIKKDCIERGLPPFGENRPGRFETSCLMFTLKPWEPGDTPESAFSHSIKLPPPHDKPKDVYKPGMSSEDYFKALCEAEAGEWVFRRVEGVKGIREGRSIPDSLAYEYRVTYFGREPRIRPVVMPQEIFQNPPSSRYEFYERKLSTLESQRKSATYERFSTSEARLSTSSESAYAYLSRGVRRAHDREHAIEGGEYIVFSESPFEVLAFQRWFTQYYYDKSSPELRNPHSRSCALRLKIPFDFLTFVLSPNKN